MTKPSLSLYANTYYPDLVYKRPSELDGAAEDHQLDRADVGEMVGVHPFEAVLSFPEEEEDELVGIAPYQAVALIGAEHIFDREEAGRLDYRDEDMIRTEEYDRYDITADEGAYVW